MRTITDAGGVTWTVTEAYQFGGDRGPAGAAPDPATRVTVLWFETESGRTASAHMPGRTLAGASEQELLGFLTGAVARHGRQP